MAPLVTRSDEVMLSAAASDLLVVLLALFITTLLAALTLLVLRRYRRSKKAAGLPLHDRFVPNKSHHRRINVTAPQPGHSQSVFVYNEKQQLLSSTSSPPSTPLPEIRITFPEELDDAGKTQSGRVVVVHVGERGDVGLEPVDETLPAYQRGPSDRFQSLDLERIGGLKEKN